jgi:hypothetical protein
MRFSKITQAGRMTVRHGSESPRPRLSAIAMMILDPRQCRDSHATDQCSLLTIPVTHAYERLSIWIEMECIYFVGCQNCWISHVIADKPSRTSQESDRGQPSRTPFRTRWCIRGTTSSRTMTGTIVNVRRLGNGTQTVDCDRTVIFSSSSN